MQEELALTKTAMLKLANGDEAALKETAITYATKMYEYREFVTAYKEALFKAVIDLKDDAEKLDETIEKDFVDARYKIENHQFSGVDPTTIEDKTSRAYIAYTDLYEKFLGKRRILVNHRYMLEGLSKIKRPGIHR